MSNEFPDQQAPPGERAGCGHQGRGQAMSSGQGVILIDNTTPRKVYYLNIMIKIR